MAKKKGWLRYRHRVIRNVAYWVLYPYARLKYGIKIEKFRQQDKRPYLILLNHQLIMGVVGLISTYIYNYYIAVKLFPEYAQEQFLTMYGMLTGTASTGIILLRQIDGDFKTPASDNMVYQNFPAIVFGFPMMLLATLAPVKPYLTLIILIGFFMVMNVILFRSFIFKKKKQKV